MRDWLMLTISELMRHSGIQRMLGLTIREIAIAIWFVIVIGGLLFAK